MITRVEVIGGEVGRVYTNHEVKDAWVSIQDDGGTLKVFLDESLPDGFTDYLTPTEPQAYP